MQKLIVVILVCFLGTLQGQENKNVVIIEKSIPENGSEKKKITIELDGEKVIDGKNYQKVTVVTKDDKDGSYTITMDKNGESKEFEWDGDGEIPAELMDNIKFIKVEKYEDDDEMKGIVINKNENLEINKTIDDKGVEKTEYTLTIDENGQKQVIKYDGIGEMPLELKKYLEKRNADRQSKKEKKIRKEIRLMNPDDAENDGYRVGKKKLKKQTQPKVKMGIIIDDESNGVQVSEVNQGSPASKAGIKAGDTILKLNDTYIFNTEGLFETLNTFSEGSEIKVTVIRNGKEKKMKLKFD